MGTSNIAEKEKIDLVIYHADCFDGAGSAWAAWKYLGDRAEYIAKQHGQNPWDIDLKDRNVAFVDFAWCQKDMEMVDSLVKTWVVLDHHEKCVEELKGYPNAILDMSRSGSGIAWEWFHGEKPLPEVLAYIQDQDLNKFEFQNTEKIGFTLALEDPTIERVEEVHTILGDWRERTRFLEIGDVLVQVQTQKTARKAAKMSKGMLLSPDGQEFPCFVFNTTSPSAVCNMALERDPNRITIGWFYDYELGYFRVSLRSDDNRPNVNKVAGLFGGGGHPHAGGFRYDGDIRDLVRLD